MSLQAVVEKVASEPAAKKFFSHPANVQSLYCPAGVRPALVAAAAQTAVSSGKFSPLASPSAKMEVTAKTEGANTPRRGLILYVTASGRSAEQVEAELAGELPASLPGKPCRMNGCLPAPTPWRSESPPCVA